MSERKVRAAGGVIWRPQRGSDSVEIVVCHRPRYDDWSLPKGKLDPDESFEQAALREVFEEVGMSCRLGTELPAVHYEDHHGRPKIVRYWMMEPEGEQPEFQPNDEVDEMRWIDIAAAGELLSYGRDADLIRAAAASLAAR